MGGGIIGGIMEDPLTFFLIVIIALAVMTLSILGTSLFYENQIEDLGQAICNKEYNMDFSSYIDDVLYCEKKEDTLSKKYDFITIQTK